MSRVGLRWVGLGGMKIKVKMRARAKVGGTDVM